MHSLLRNLVMFGNLQCLHQMPLLTYLILNTTFHMNFSTLKNLGFFFLLSLAQYSNFVTPTSISTSLLLAYSFILPLVAILTL